MDVQGITSSRMVNISSNLPTAEDWETWQQVIASRRHHSFETLPVEQQTQLLQLKALVLLIDSNAQLFLIGSWVNGGWADASTDKAILELRWKMKRKKGLSDLDVVIASKQDIDLRTLVKQVDFALSLSKGIVSNQKYLVI